MQQSSLLTVMLFIRAELAEAAQYSMRVSQACFNVGQGLMRLSLPATSGSTANLEDFSCVVSCLDHLHVRSSITPLVNVDPSRNARHDHAGLCSIG